MAAASRTLTPREEIVKLLDSARQQTEKCFAAFQQAQGAVAALEAALRILDAAEKREG